MAAAARALFLSRVDDLSLRSLSSRQPFLRPLLTSVATTKRNKPYHQQATVLNCFVSGVDGGGIADDFVSTRNSVFFKKEFSVIAEMLKRIEPLDTSVISKSVSSAARDSMKRTISTMLGLLPSDQFFVTIRVSRGPLDRLLTSSIITGYTLWNAEYRVSLMRNFDLSFESSDASVSSSEDLGVRRIPGNLGNLSPEALNYIRELESEVASVKKDLNARKQEKLCMERNREENSDLLEYLRSFEPDMVSELSQPSSPEVEEIIHQLVQNILQRLFNYNTVSSAFSEELTLGEKENNLNGDVELYDTIGTSRDYLAKLLFWFVLLLYQPCCTC
ncbi:Protein of unknown function DUF760 [Macleaya cordata]|uniref:Seed maturation-like protein n=1 Tax=Macleaya cordata TaxID=56857 RepID=A0A200QV55_MACCD|nr:Protein of unknown function DUF760 [Macleaya cordata]